MKDIHIIRELAAEYAQAANSDQNREKIRLHTAVNDLQMIRPIVLIDEIPWGEMAIGEELTLRCEDEDFRRLEGRLRRSLYQWKHMPADMALPNYFAVEKIIHSTGIGVEVEEELIEGGQVSSHKYHNVFQEAGLEMLHEPVITYDREETARQWEKVGEAVGDILPVKIVGEATGYGLGCKTWDTIATLMGADDLLFGLVDDPDFMHGLARKLTDIFLNTVKQYERLNLIDMDAMYCHCASALTSGMPKEPGDLAHNNLKKVWGRGLAQIFAAVSPQMHEEFDIQYMKEAMEPFGYVYYGCCEPLDLKVSMLRKIPNLRKISVSPWCNSEKIIREVGTDYVMSRKPNPAIVAGNMFDEAQAEKEIREFMELTEGQCHVELIFKDISTVRHDPQRLFKWEKIAMRVAGDYAK